MASGPAQLLYADKVRLVRARLAHLLPPEPAPQEAKRTLSLTASLFVSDNLTRTPDVRFPLAPGTRSELAKHQLETASHPGGTLKRPRFASRPYATSAVDFSEDPQVVAPSAKSKSSGVKPFPIPSATIIEMA